MEKLEIFEQLNLTDDKIITFISDNFFDLETKKSDKYLNHIFYFKDNKCIFCYDLNNKYCYVNYQRIWEFFEKEFNYRYYDTSKLIELIIKEIYQLEIELTLAIIFLQIFGKDLI